MEETFDWAAYVAMMTELHGLHVSDDRQEAVVEQLRRIAAMANDLLAFPLPFDIEAAPIFRP